VVGSIHLKKDLQRGDADAMTQTTHAGPPERAASDLFAACEPPMRARRAALEGKDDPTGYTAAAAERSSFQVRSNSPT
jgi:hypothetical protein